MATDNNASSGRIDFVIADGVASVTINRPLKRNALTQAMWAELAEIVEDAGSRSGVVLIRGAGTDFSAGADIAEFSTLRAESRAQDGEPESPAAFAAIRNCAVPTIAAIRGICFGGGFGIAAACDIRIGTADSTYCVPAARLGLAYPVDAMRDIVQSCGPQMARWLTFSGRRMDAARALSCGFLSDVVAGEELDAEADGLASDIAQNAPLSIAAARAAIDAALATDPSYRAEAIRRARIALDSEDYAEGRAAFADRRKPVFRGS